MNEPGMSDNTMDVLVAAYRDIDTARQDVDAVTHLVHDKSVTLEGVILVEHDADGQVTGSAPATTSVARAWAGAGVSAWSSACSQPPLLASVAVGAAAGGWSASSPSTD